MAQSERYDAIIIGDGQAGGPLSTALAGARRTVAVIEREHAGGTCINVGCTAVEFGQMFRRFGSAVTIVQRGSQLLAREDADIAAAVATILREDGITILFESEAQRVERADGGPVRVVARTPDGERMLEGSRLLLAVGRLPNTDDLNLAAAGVETGRGGYIRVNA